MPMCFRLPFECATRGQRVPTLHYRRNISAKNRRERFTGNPNRNRYAQLGFSVGWAFMPTRFQAAFECATRGQRVPTLPCCIKKQLENYNHSNEFAFSFNLSNKISALTLMEFLYSFGIFFSTLLNQSSNTFFHWATSDSFSLPVKSLGDFSETNSNISI